MRDTIDLLFYTENVLKSLYLKQRYKVEEIKKKTNYYSTKSLIDRYDASSSSLPSTPVRPRHNIASSPETPGSLSTPPIRVTPENTGDQGNSQRSTSKIINKC
jgi:endoplasmic reticulum junction formation protein lunapark